MNEQYSQSDRSDKFNSPQIELEDAIGKPDLSKVESKDPSLIDGYKIIYNKEIPLDIKIETKDGPKDLASYELIGCKILSDAANPEETPTRVKFELSWERDLNFHFFNIVDEETFAVIKKKQNLNLEFAQYCNLVTKICDDCLKTPDTYIGEFTIQNDGVSKLLFIKGSDFKYLDLLSLEFTKSPEDMIQKHMLYRFAYLKAKISYYKKAIKTAGDVILDCNPDVVTPMLDNYDNYKLDIDKFFSNKKVEN